MGESLLKITGIALLGVSAVLVLKAYRPEFAMQISIATGVVILLYTVTLAVEFRIQLQEFFEKYGLNPAVFKATLKITGIAYIAQFAADTCRDCGESSVASKVELAGRIMIVLAAFPIIASTVAAIEEIIS